MGGRLASVSRNSKQWLSRNSIAAELGTLLTGRYVPFEIFPFSFEEFAAAKRLKRDKTALLDYLQSGGLPELIHLQSEEARRHYVMALRDAIHLL
jgi:uncharacterized protein